MKIRVRLIDFLSMCNGQLTGKEYFNKLSEAKEEDFMEKYGIEKATLEKMKQATRKGNFRILQGVELNYCMFCGASLESNTCKNCGATFKLKKVASVEGALTKTEVFRIIGKKRVHGCIDTRAGNSVYTAVQNEASLN